jgi:hypothetical protein
MGFRFRRPVTLIPGVRPRIWIVLGLAALVSGAWILPATQLPARELAQAAKPDGRLAAKAAARSSAPDSVASIPHATAPRSQHPAHPRNRHHRRLKQKPAPPAPALQFPGAPALGSPK